MVAVVPRSWWSSERFSGGLARFSEPLVALTDSFVGERHAMRVDVTSAAGDAVAAIQTHDSFRRCVGQSCAEFCLDLLDHGAAPGVRLPEALYAAPEPRRRILKRLSSTSGTTSFGVDRVS